MADFIVGLTGGIGSGKSTVATLFADNGIALVDADVVARQVVAPGSQALAAIAEHFGPTVLQADGQLNRAALRLQVFSDEAARQWLNQLLHPLIREQMQQQLAAATSPYVLWVVPLLLENGLNQDCDRVLVVDAPADTQRQRVLARDASADADAIMARQLSRRERLAAADDIIDNSGTPDALAEQVDVLHQRYLSLAAQKRL
ncbi:dephospho-CoA kinase [Gallaecimonas sp. GXIMD1310]|uniref:dephospho-CoA kinase n=1 Tax=Gallaecimonas sp. GXIMD1310 TaxID=3131926 RepID=UPI003248416B